MDKAPILGAIPRPMASNAAYDATGNGKKRRRPAKSCEQCRLRKVKCMYISYKHRLAQDCEVCSSATCALCVHRKVLFFDHVTLIMGDKY